MSNKQPQWGLAASVMPCFAVSAAEVRSSFAIPVGDQALHAATASTAATNEKWRLIRQTLQAGITQGNDVT